MADRQHGCASLRLSVKASDRASALEDLRKFFEVAREHEFAEIWVDHDPFPSLCALLHRKSAWLMYLRYDGDAGFSSRNPGFRGHGDLPMQFMLSNGQVDEYPASWTYPAETAFEALVEFARDGRVPDSIVWFNDSGDGAASPNEPFANPS
jgi:hypothetical protein